MISMVSGDMTVPTSSCRETSEPSAAASAAKKA